MAKAYERLRETIPADRNRANEARAATLLQMEELRQAIVQAETELQARRNNLDTATSFVDAFLDILNAIMAKQGGSLHLVANFPAGQTEIESLSSLTMPPSA